MPETRRTAATGVSHNTSADPALTDPAGVVTPERPPRRAHQSGGTDNLAAYSDVQSLATALMSRFTGVESMIGNVKVMLGSFKDELMIKLTDMQERLESRIVSLEIENQSLSASLIKQQKDHETLENRVRVLEQGYKICERRELESEQYSRKNLMPG